MKYEHIKHPWNAIYDEYSKVLILGSLPSPKSRESDFYYGHPQNRFWKVLAAIFNEAVPQTIEEKQTMLLRNNIAIWDVIDECDIEGASDASIKNVVPTRIKDIIASSQIKKVICNGAKAYELYCKYQLEETAIPAVKLPSTSPANAACKLNTLIDTWRKELITRYSMRALFESDVDMIYEMSCKNKTFYQYHPPFVTKVSIIEDIKALPPNKTYDDKHYIGFFDGETLVANMDLILSYPMKDVALIGLFMMNVDYQHKGIGSEIISDICNYLKRLKFTKVRIGVDKGNDQSFAFWTKNEFTVVDRAEYIVMERNL